METKPIGAIVSVPAFEPGRGGGHLTRCAKLTADLRAMGRQAFLFLSTYSEGIDKLFSSMGFNTEWLVKEDGLRDIRADIECIVLDYFRTLPQEFARWKKIAPVIGIDEGGVKRDSFDFLVDILVPQKLSKPPANITDPSLLKFPPKALIKKRKADGILRILVSFGQEDPAGFGPVVANALTEKNYADMEITLLRGGLGTGNRGIDVIPNLAEYLGEYDLVITHYGITAYEALYAGTSVLLVNPTRYHEKLSKAAGFYTIGSKFFHAKGKTINIFFVSLRLCSFVRNKNRINSLKKRCKDLSVRYGLDKKSGISLATLVNGLSPIVNRHCPVCSAGTSGGSVARFNDRTYRRCYKYGIIYMDRVCPPPIEYEREYFFEKYEEQYGKTYIEDFPNLMAMARLRLKFIKGIREHAIERGEFYFGNVTSDNSFLPLSPTVLDIGCAYGQFLLAAREEGFSPVGIDPAEEAVRYVQRELGIPAVHGFFPNGSLLGLPASYDIITLWYVIEHFRDCVSVLAEIKKLLKPGGILAFSTPSFSGISGRVSLKRFLERSPGDHWTIWSPKTSVRALALAGFKVKKIVVRGHHPERFPLLGKFAKSKKSPVYWLLLAISRIFRLGDTFEVYAQAEKNKS